MWFCKTERCLTCPITCRAWRNIRINKAILCSLSIIGWKPSNQIKMQFPDEWHCKTTKSNFFQSVNLKPVSTNELFSSAQLVQNNTHKPLNLHFLTKYSASLNSRARVPNIQEILRPYSTSSFGDMAGGSLVPPCSGPQRPLYAWVKHISGSSLGRRGKIHCTKKNKREKSNTHPEIQGNLVQIVATLCSEIAFHRIEQTSRRSEEEVQDYLEEWLKQAEKERTRAEFFYAIEWNKFIG